MIVVCGGIKGGSGKTMLATNLTVMRSASGKRVLLVDGDEQHSASDWHNIRDSLGVSSSWTIIQLSGKFLYSEIQKMMKDYDDIIVDVGGRDTTTQRSALCIADIFVTPFRPRSVDIWTLPQLHDMVEAISVGNHKLKCCAVINQADAIGIDNKEALSTISEYKEFNCIATYIGLRKAFANAMTDGLGVCELNKKMSDQKAVQEIELLYKSIYE